VRENLKKIGGNTPWQNHTRERPEKNRGTRYKMLWNYKDPTDPTVLDLSISNGNIVAFTGHGYLCFLDRQGVL